MDANPDTQKPFVLTMFPWLVAAGALVVYALTLNHWVSLASLPYVGKAAGWDWSLPQQEPLYFLLTLPVRLFPAGIQPLVLNFLAAVCAALTLALLARSVSILPHDRTHEQRQRERSRHAIFSSRHNWMPPLFAVLVCGFQLTFWERATASTGEMLNFLLLAWCVRCVLEYRIDPRQSWMNKMALVYGLSVANNWAMIGFFPLFLLAIIWIKGISFFNLRFFVRTAAWGAAGLLLYLVLPVIWALSDSGLGFWEVLRANLGGQKAQLLHMPGLRNRALLLSLTSILPLLWIGVRWPSTFGDTSAAGNVITTLMFRVINLAFLTACLIVAFDPKFSPRALGLGIPFLTFYFLGALAIGYFSGYVLLVFGPSRAKSRHRQSALTAALNGALRVVLWIALIAVPAGLLYKNLPRLQAANAPALQELARMLARNLPEEGAYVLADDRYGMTLLEGQLRREGIAQKHVLVHSGALQIPFYHRVLARRYPGRWEVPSLHDLDTEVSPLVLIDLVTQLIKENRVFYLHPSFGYYFERAHMEPRGLLQELVLFPPGELFPPPLDEQTTASNLAFWQEAQPVLQSVQKLSELEEMDTRFAAMYYSRGLNTFGVQLQRSGDFETAVSFFKSASEMNTNNIPARVNLDFNEKYRRSETELRPISNLEDRFGLYRSWESILGDNGPFDTPDISYLLGDLFLSQALYRQAAIQFKRVSELAPTNIEGPVALAAALLTSRLPDRAIALIHEIRSNPQFQPLDSTNRVQLVRLEAAAEVGRTNFDAAEKILTQARADLPANPLLLTTLVEVHAAAERWDDALALIDKEHQAKKNLPLLLQKAEILVQAGRTDQAIETIGEILALSPNHHRALIFRGALRLQNKQYPEALADFDQVLRTEPDHSEALLSQAATYLELEKYEEALPPLNRLLKLRPGHWAAIKNRAIAYLKLDKLKPARKDFELLAKIAPGFYQAHFGLGEIAYRQKRFEDAATHYEQYLRFAPPDPSGEAATERDLVEQRLKEIQASQR